MVVNWSSVFLHSIKIPKRSHDAFQQRIMRSRFLDSCIKSGIQGRGYSGRGICTNFLRYSRETRAVFFRCTHSQQVANYGYQGGIRLRLQRLIVLYKIADKHFTALIITSSEQCGHIYRIQVPIPMSTLAALVTKIHTFFYKKPRERGSRKSFLKFWSSQV